MNDEHYETSDLGLAAALTVSSHLLLDVDMTNPRRAVFIFEGKESPALSAQKFWKRQLQVDALMYFEAIKTLKSIIYGSSSWK